MSEDFMSALADEIARLEVELRDNAVFMKWRELQKVLGMYTVSQSAGETSSLEAAFRTQTATHFRRESPSRERGRRLVRNLLRGRMQPTPTRDILTFLEINGVQTPGKDPVSYLSAWLSNSDEFLSQGRAGWVLKTEDDGADDGDHRSVQSMLDEYLETGR